MADETTVQEKVEDKDEVISKLKEQVDNLNKGIGSYRDEAKAAREDAAKASQTAKEALSKLSDFEGLFNKKEKGIELSDEDEQKLAEYAKKHGLVSKADLDKQRLEVAQSQVKAFEDQAVAEFLEHHPDYDNDEKWKEIMTEFVLYKQPTTLAGYRSLLSRIEKDLSKKNSDDAQARARAEIIKRSKLSLGGGRQGSSEDDTEARIEALHKRYPNLSRDQIIDRLSEIASLPKKK